MSNYLALPAASYCAAVIILLTGLGFRAPAREVALTEPSSAPVSTGKPSHAATNTSDSADGPCWDLENRRNDRPQADGDLAFAFAVTKSRSCALDAFGGLAANALDSSGDRKVIPVGRPDRPAEGLYAPNLVVNGGRITKVPVEGFFINSKTGDDLGSGSMAMPWRTLARALATVTTNGAASNRIWLARGSVFREDLKLRNNLYVGAYSFGTNPIISGAEILTNSYFFPAAACTNTYAYRIDPPAYAGYVVSSNVLMVWEDGYRLGGGGVYVRLPDRNNLSGTNAVCTTPGSWWYDATNRLLYVHTPDGGDPRTNGRVYEASVRTLCVWAGTNTVCEDLIAEKAGAKDTTGSQGYLFFGDSNNTLRRCIGRQAGFTHAIGVANAVAGYFNCFDCLAEDCPTNMSSTPFVWYKSGAATGTGIASNCWARQTLPGNRNFPVNGYYAHDEMGGLSPSCKIKVTLYNCGVENCEIAQGPYNILTDAMSLATNTWVYGISSSWAPGALQSNYTMRAVLRNGSAHPQVGGTLNLVDSTFYEATLGMGYESCRVRMTNCQFYSAGSSLQFVQMGLASVALDSSVSNTFNGGVSVYSCDVPSHLNVSNADWNCYYNTFVGYTWQQYHTWTLPQWQGSYPALDQHSRSGAVAPLPVPTFRFTPELGGSVGSNIIAADYVAGQPSTFRVRFAGLPGATYRVEASSDLTHWIPIAGSEVIVPDNGRNIGVGGFVETDPPGASRYYRAVHVFGP